MVLVINASIFWLWLTTLFWCCNKKYCTQLELDFFYIKVINVRMVFYFPLFVMQLWESLKSFKLVFAGALFGGTNAFISSLSHIIYYILNLYTDWIIVLYSWYEWAILLMHFASSEAWTTSDVCIKRLVIHIKCAFICLSTAASFALTALKQLHLPVCGITSPWSRGMKFL